MELRILSYGCRIVVIKISDRNPCTLFAQFCGHPCICELLADGMTEISTRNITNNVALMQYRLFTQNHMLRIIKYQTHQAPGQSIGIQFIESLSTFISRTLAHCEEKSCLYWIV